MTTAERLREAVRLEHCYSALAQAAQQAADELEALTKERDTLEAEKSLTMKHVNVLFDERDDLKAKLAQVEADAAVVREAIHAIKEDDENYLVDRDDQLTTTQRLNICRKAISARSGQRLLDELARWQKQAKDTQECNQRIYDELADLRQQVETLPKVANDELATLRATAQRRLELLRKYETHVLGCIFCGGAPESRHKPNCPLAQELNEGK